MDESTEIIKSVLPYVGGAGVVILCLALLFKDSIKVFLEKDSENKVLLKEHEARINRLEENIQVLPAIQSELKSIRDSLNQILAHILTSK